MALSDILFNWQRQKHFLNPLILSLFWQVYFEISVANSTSGARTKCFVLPLNMPFCKMKDKKGKTEKHYSK